MSDAETALMNGLLMSVIPHENTDPSEGLLQLAADFWLTNHRHVDSAAVVPLLSHPGLAPEKAFRIAELGSGCTDVVCAYLIRPDPVAWMAKAIAATHPDVLRLAVSSSQKLRLEVAELLADVDDWELLLVLASCNHVPFLTAVRALTRVHSMPPPPPTTNVRGQVQRAAKDLFNHRRLDNAAEVASALRLLQDTPDLLTVFETSIAACTTVVLTEEAVALLRWSANLTHRRKGSTGAKWLSSEATRTAVFNYLNRRFGMHTPSWDMFAKLASPDQRIGEIADLVLEVETPDNS